MNVAACISGQLRFFEKSFELLQTNFLNLYHPDVFIHTWYNPAFENRQFESSHTKASQGSYSSNDLNKCILLYNPKCIAVSEPTNFYSFKIGSRENNACSMFYSIYSANNLKQNYETKNDKKYDWVLRLRFDWAYSNKVDLSLLDTAYIYVPDADQTTSNPNNLHINDQFAIGSSKNMDIYSNAFLHASTVSTQGNENILYNTLVSNNIAVKTLDWQHCFPPNDFYGTGSPNSLFRQ